MPVSRALIGAVTVLTALSTDSVIMVSALLIGAVMASIVLPTLVFAERQDFLAVFDAVATLCNGNPLDLRCTDTGSIGEEDGIARLVPSLGTIAAIDLFSPSICAFDRYCA
jgi:hypothetical protein